MKNLLNSLLVIIFIMIGATAYGKNLCVNKGYTLGYFNGMVTTKAEAKNQLYKFEKIYGDTYDNQSIKYELFYNYSVLEESKVFGGYYDLQELMDQKSVEFLTDPEAAREYWDVFWYVMQEQDGNYGETTKLLEECKKKFPQFTSLIDGLSLAKKELESNILAEQVVKIEENNLSERTLLDYKEHQDRLVTILTEGRKAILVGYSQGSLLANHAYESVVGKQDAIFHNMKTSVGVELIGPTSHKNYGSYVLNTGDVIINALHRHLANRYPGKTLILEGNFSEQDWSVVGAVNHFFNSYMKNGSIGRMMITNDLNHFFTNLETPPAMGNEGLFTATLTWDGFGDIDLYVDEPTGTRVYFDHNQGDAGYLDVDNTWSYGPEHYYASCEEERIREGVYSIGANNHSRGNGRVATVHLSTYSGGALSSKSIPVGNSCGSNCDIKHFFNVKLMKTENGEVEITVE